MIFLIIIKLINMKPVVALLLCSSVAIADENYSTNYDVKRTDKNVKYVFQISA